MGACTGDQVEDGCRDVLSVGSRAFHTQLVNDASGVVFHLLPAQAALVSVGPSTCKVWGRGASLKRNPKVDVYSE